MGWRSLGPGWKELALKEGGRKGCFRELPWQEYVSVEAMDSGTPLGENEGVGASVILPGRKAPPVLWPYECSVQARANLQPLSSALELSSTGALLVGHRHTLLPSLTEERQTHRTDLSRSHTVRPGVASCFCKMQSIDTLGIVTQAVSVAMTQHYFVQQKQPQT